MGVRTGMLVGQSALVYTNDEPAKAPKKPKPQPQPGALQLPKTDGRGRTWLKYGFMRHVWVWFASNPYNIRARSTCCR